VKAVDSGDSTSASRARLATMIDGRAAARLLAAARPATRYRSMLTESTRYGRTGASLPRMIEGWPAGPRTVEGSLRQGPSVECGLAVA
jgi:hypothetical protein